METTFTKNRIRSRSLRALFSTLFSLCFVVLPAQSGLTFYTDIGQNNVSRGVYIKSAIMGYYSAGKYKLETGFQTDLKNYSGSGFSGYAINSSRSFVIKGIPVELNAFYVETHFSEILSETNWGALLRMRNNHFGMTIGTNLRTYSFDHRAVKDYHIDKKNTSVQEIYNLMYSFNYYLKATDDNWNAGLSVTNIDHFTINQETNPVFKVNGLYKLRAPISLYIQAWYKYAGVTNLELNHFGFFFRSGIIWDIK